MLHALSKLHVCILGVLDDVVRLLFGGLDGGVLDYHCFGEILEELIQLFEGLFDLLNVVVAGANGAKD